MNKSLTIKIVIILFCTCFTFNCKSNSTTLEKNIFHEIFDELVDLTITDYRKLVVPSPDDFENNESKRKLNERAETKRNEVLDPLIVFINDTIKVPNFQKEQLNKIKPHLEEKDFVSILEKIKKNNEKLTFEYKLFEVDTSKYKLLSFNDKREKEYKMRTDLATYSLSRISFNEERTVGVFSISIVYSGLNAYGFIVIIDKTDSNNWKINKLIEDWES